MKISDATLLACETQKGITRRSWMPKEPIILPTNSNSGCIIQPYSISSSLGARWQPAVDDLIADDWIAVGILSEKG